ncbi:MAG: hypothetical protein Q8R90_00110 [Bacteroidales bacterium]|nr:hypothetical protein [Bacteroidales bacterium]
MKKSIFLIAAFAILILSSCTKEEQVFGNKDEMLKQDSYIEVTSASTDAILGEILRMNASYPATKAIWGERFLTGTVTITIRDSSGVRIFLVDFGTGNTGPDGKVRKGKLAAYIVNNGKTGSEQKIKYIDFVEDGYMFSGWVGRTITRDIDAKTQQALITEDFKVTIPDGTKFTKRVATLNRLIKMGDLATKDDDIIECYGTITVTNEKNESRTRVIDAATPLIFNVSASEIVKGIAKTTFPDGKTLTIDYGDGTVDNTATVSDGTKTWTITLKKTK